MNGIAFPRIEEFVLEETDVSDGWINVISQMEGLRKLQFGERIYDKQIEMLSEVLPNLSEIKLKIFSDVRGGTIVNFIEKSGNLRQMEIHAGSKLEILDELREKFESQWEITEFSTDSSKHCLHLERMIERNEEHGIRKRVKKL